MMDDKDEEIVILGIDHPSNDGQRIIQSKQLRGVKQELEGWEVRVITSKHH